MQYHKEDMIGQLYQWNEDKQLLSGGTPSRKAFDRFNGYQVLYIINYYASFFENFSKEQGRLVERMIMNDLPVEVRSEMSVFNWISVTEKKINSSN